MLENKETAKAYAIIIDVLSIEKDLGQMTAWGWYIILHWEKRGVGNLSYLSLAITTTGLSSSFRNVK
jgi:hypothetical protein